MKRSFPKSGRGCECAGSREDRQGMYAIVERLVYALAHCLEHCGDVVWSTERDVFFMASAKNGKGVNIIFL
jgi:hypothetical protein